MHNVTGGQKCHEIAGVTLHTVSKPCIWVDAALDKLCKFHSAKFEFSSQFSIALVW